MSSVRLGSHGSWQLVATAFASPDYLTEGLLEQVDRLAEVFLAVAA